MLVFHGISLLIVSLYDSLNLCNKFYKILTRIVKVLFMKTKLMNL
jgi:hypothetical protein